MDPAQTKISFTLGATAHTVHGRFSLTKGELSFDPGSGRVEGEIVIDARSGNTDNDGRDSKMHKDVLESANFPEIVFRPDRAEGFSAASGTLSGTVHGEFVIHGNHHEMSVPVSVQFAAERWNASAKFTVPYVDWGLKNPSTFLLRVSKTVDVDVETSGSLKNLAAPD
ncbi:MAG TPA: YceI family protein [Candidatus Acidoferrales bacterium]|nr:YceI family protein [Candidatus Acidoferrales bacterium]